jgi:hypothetical protein
VARLELYGTASCPYTQELRESLEWSQRDFLEYDIDSSLRTVPVLVEDGKVIQVGWQGHGCVVGWGS